MRKLTSVVLTGGATISTVLAAGLAYYQFFAVASNDDVVEKLSSIEAFFKSGEVDKLSDEAVREVVKKLDETTQELVQKVSTRGIRDLPVIYLKEGGVSVAVNKDATFQTGSGVKSIFGVNSVSSNRAFVRVDGVSKYVYSGDIVMSSRDPKCSYFVGELNSRGNPDYVKVRLVCE